LLSHQFWFAAKKQEQKENTIGYSINRFISFRYRTPSPEGEGWDEGEINMQELMKRLIPIFNFIAYRLIKSPKGTRCVPGLLFRSFRPPLNRGLVQQPVQIVVRFAHTI
jgi:hypothetical protein